MGRRWAAVRTSRGFTFIELLVVTTIVLILASAIMPLSKVTVQRQREAEVLDVVRLDQLELGREALETERLADREAEAELGVETTERGREHLADLAVPALG